MNKKYITIAELAKMQGVSRIAIFKKVKKGEIKADLVGKTYVIPIQQAEYFLGKELSASDKKEIDSAVNKTVKEYGDVLRLLGKEE